MIKNLKIKKRLMQLGLTSIAIVNGAISLGCTQIKITDIPEPTRIESIEPEETKEVEVTPEITEEPTIVPTETPSPTPTEEPTPTPYDPYELTDEEAIEMGSYIYDNYIARYAAMEGTLFNDYSSRYGREDIINLVCLFNQKTPVIYDDRYACQDGNYMHVNNFYEFVIDATAMINIREGKIENFPYSLFMKEGRPERELLEKLETNFNYVTNNEVSEEELYECWGKALWLAANDKETFKEWNTFNLPMFYYYVRQQFDQFMLLNDKFAVNDTTIPAKYVFDNDKGQKLNIIDAIGYVDSTNRKTYSFLTDEEYDSYIGCMDRILVKYIMEYDKENGYIVKQKEKDGH